MEEALVLQCQQIRPLCSTGCSARDFCQNVSRPRIVLGADRKKQALDRAFYGGYPIFESALQRIYNFSNRLTACDAVAELP